MRLSRLLVLLLVLPLAVAPALAASDGKMILRFGLAYVSPTGDWSGNLSEGGFETPATIEAESATGYGAGFEFLFTKMIGLDLNVFTSDHDVKARALGKNVPLADTTLTSLMLGVNFHVGSSSSVDVYVGPLVGYVDYGDLELVQDAGSVALKTDVGFGANLGMDVPLGGRGWLLQLSLKYLQTSADVDGPVEPGDPDSIDMSPLILGVGAGYRF